MGKITKKRPHGFKTETEAWDEDTNDLEFVEKEIKKGVTEDNSFSLASKVYDVSDRSSLCSDKKYIERIKYCKKLIDKIHKEEKTNKETQKTILFGLELRKEELEKEIEKAERSCPTTQKNIVELDFKKRELGDELDDIRKQIKEHGGKND